MAEDEAQLVKEIQRGSEQAFVTLYNRYRVPLFRFAWRMIGSVEAAEDVTQDCFLAFATGSAYDPGRSPLQTYLFGVARHIVFRRLRMSAREEPGAAPDEPAEPRDVLGDLLASERSELVRRAIEELPALQREAIVLFEYEDLPLEEIATITRAEVGAIKARLSRARESLRKRLAPLLARPAERRCS